jgi:hypothetical protein
LRREFRDRWEKWGGNGVKNLTELSNPSLSSQLCFARYSFLRRAIDISYKGLISVENSGYIIEYKAISQARPHALKSLDWHSL